MSEGGSLRYRSDHLGDQLVNSNVQPSGTDTMNAHLPRT